MTLRERILACLLVLAAGAFTIGIALYEARAAWLVGAALFAVWSWLVLAGDDE